VCPGDPAEALPLAVRARDNLLVLAGGRPGRGLLHAEFHGRAPRTSMGVTWAGRRNGCAPGMVYMRVTDRSGRPGWTVRSVAGWNTYWGLPQAHALCVEPCFHGRQGRSPADYVLRAHTPGWRRATDGTDLGCRAQRLAWVTWQRR